MTEQDQEAHIAKMQQAISTSIDIIKDKLGENATKHSIRKVVLRASEKLLTPLSPSVPTAITDSEKRAYYLVAKQIEAIMGHDCHLTDSISLQTILADIAEEMGAKLNSKRLTDEHPADKSPIKLGTTR